jgi:Fic-DOC domain mobile mystery protein B
MSDLFDQAEGATPLEAEEKEALKQSWVTTRADMNRVEADNIAKAYGWSKNKRQTDILSRQFVAELHRRMFGDVWTWAGKYRSSQKNIGIAAYQVPEAIETLIGDILFWMKRATYDSDEIAVRLHHRLTIIHPFVNGNGRHARLLADLLVVQLGRQPFSWGRASLQEIGKTRSSYIAALRAADDNDMEPLLVFARN